MALDSNPESARPELGFDPGALREKYKLEREKRLRTDGNDQYRRIEGELSHILDDPHVEPGLVRDIPEFFERIAPRDHPYHHEETWHDGNGHSHVRASLLGPSLVVPVESGRLLLGTWLQVILVDFDNRPRRRSIVVQLSGVVR